MIITVTLNPALDKTAAVDVMQANALNRLGSVTTDAGGKGVNVSALVKNLGGATLATGFAGGHTGEELLSRISDRGIDHDFVRIKAATRTNLKVMAKDGRLTELNEPGPLVLGEEWEALEKKLLSFAAVKGTLFVLSGSLPRGLQDDTYKKLCIALQSAGAKVFVDADGEAFRLAMEAPPDFIKPNRYELLQYFGVEDKGERTGGYLLGLLRKLLGRGVKLAALSLGGAGALFASGEYAWRADALSVPIRSTVGAGDSMTGALAYGIDKGLPLEECLALSLAASAGAVTTAGTKAPEAPVVNALLKQVTLRPVDSAFFS
ncbi:MAG: 1-phosphofructokinase family hexose kinase [Treponema sp.]|jgi:1-phosphofructokinase|nr:1-phosphofructokinase family hexose kinase [Treponema sp.]